MTDIREYITLSLTASAISSAYTIPADFKYYYNNIGDKEKKALVRYFIVSNIPFAFKDKPILHEQITQYIADKLYISPSEVKLIGSAKIGFSISPYPNYGKKIGEHSDLDFSIVHGILFDTLEDEFPNWSNLYRTKEIKPNNNTEESYWAQNIFNEARQLNRGFIDTHFIPNRSLFPTTQKINNSVWLIKKILAEKHGINVKKASASLYKNWDSFEARLNTNTESIMKKV
jgi:hypothetical protein